MNCAIFEENSNYSVLVPPLLSVTLSSIPQKHNRWPLSLHDSSSLTLLLIYPSIISIIITIIIIPIHAITILHPRIPITKYPLHNSTCFYASAIVTTTLHVKLPTLEYLRRRWHVSIPPLRSNVSQSGNLTEAPEPYSPHPAFLLRKSSLFTLCMP